MNTQQHEATARHHIQNLIANYARGIDTRDEVLFRSLWVPEARWLIGDSEMIGADQIAAGAQGFWDTYSRMWHCFAVPVIHVLGDRAVGECLVNATLVKPDGAAEQAIARYSDEYEFTDGTWLFSKRTTVIERQVTTQ